MNVGNEYGTNYRHDSGPYGENLPANENLPGENNSHILNQEKTNISRKHVPERGYGSEGSSLQYAMPQGYAYGISVGPTQEFYKPNQQFIPSQSPTQQGSFVGEVPTPPLMTNIAYMYGNQIMDSGKKIVDKEINKYVSMSRLRCYFAVDTKYTLEKLKIVLFPYTNSNWSPKVHPGQQVMPKEDVNAPDLYIPLMAYITYVLLASYVIGNQKGFSPEVLGILATQALGYTLMELVVQLLTIYIINLRTCLSTWDLVAFSGYKFVGIIVALLTNTLINRQGYYISVIYCGISVSLFMVRSLKWRMMDDKPDEYVSHLNGVEKSYNGGVRYQSKRRFYFLLLVGVSQPVLIWWHSYMLERYYSPAS